MKLGGFQYCWLLAALAAVGASADQTATTTDWSTSAKAIDAESYESGTVHALNGAKQSVPYSSAPSSIGFESDAMTSAVQQSVPMATPSKTKPGTMATKTPMLAPIINIAQDVFTAERPIPTNKWWGNLIHTTEKDRDTVANPAWSNPYAVKLPKKDAPFGLQACYSYTYRQKAALKDDKIKFYLHEYHNDLTLSAQEFTAKPNYEIYDWSDLGASLRICTGTGGAQSTQCMKSSLVNGMAFISSTYEGLTPKIASEYAITKLEQGAEGKYVIQLENKQTWVLYTSTATTLKIDGTGKAIVASAAYTGSIRVAVVPANASVDVYDSFASCTVLGGTVSVESRTQYSLNWDVEGSSCDSTGLLHFAFQHQIDSMSNAAQSVNTTDAIQLESTVRGTMVGQIKRKSASSNSIKWTLTEPELTDDIDFYPPRKPVATAVAQIKQALEADIASDWILAKDGSYYFNGKAYQKYASLCLMADDESIMGSDKTLKATCLTKLKALIEPFLANGWAAPLAYETTYRGIISSLVFQTNDVNVEFGNGVYNDHHYHYGYWIAASAMLKKLDPTWSRMAELEEIVWSLLRDVANPSSEDKYFPTFRHFSWFLGHSYSHGVTPLADGKDQESTSEDVNFLYGMMLWGKVTGNKAVEDLGSLMLRIDARAIRTYFLMDSNNKVHPPEFVRNHVTGIFFDNKVDYATWFSPEKYCIHGIQMIPVSPINEIVRTRQFIKEEWDDILSNEAIVKDASSTSAWLSLLYVNYATIDQQAAMQRLATVQMDDGLTRSWALYNAATRPTGSSTSTTPTPEASVVTPTATATPSTAPYAPAY
uniref:glucan endo-1,3-beta-D-glucosidase n=1 Tax=Globisporangium ultimum (strain ATCC 200006 / CBS 805.95 / DAOM BR144) TaxID=431595 RepID=K3WBF8_GLOUD